MSNATTAQRRIKRFVLYPLQAVLVYALYGFFWLLPLDRASAVGGWMGRTIGPLFVSHTRILASIKKAFPEKSDEEHRRIMVGMWDNLGRVISEYPHLAAFDDSRVELIGIEHLEAYRANPRASIMVSGHFANWEVMPVCAAKQGLHLQLIYRHANNPYVDHLLSYARTPMGDRLARKGVQGARSVHGALRNNDVIGMLVDQKHSRGRAIPFFGRPAMTAPAVAELALRYNAPVLLTYVERLEGAHFRVTVLPPMTIEQRATEQETVDGILTAINAQLEAWVRQKPEHWLWLHRRWGE